MLNCQYEQPAGYGTTHKTDARTLLKPPRAHRPKMICRQDTERWQSMFDNGTNRSSRYMYEKESSIEHSHRHPSWKCSQLGGAREGAAHILPHLQRVNGTTADWLSTPRYTRNRRRRQVSFAARVAWAASCSHW